MPPTKTVRQQFSNYHKARKIASSNEYQDVLLRRYGSILLPQFCNAKNRLVPLSDTHQIE
jgi:hypothetical protein